jgi:Protein of unknown function (DUF2946)
MHKFRYGNRFGTWLALFALAVQFAVSFGHVHVDGIRAVGSASAIVVRQTPTAQSLPLPQPADKDDYCAICASIYLAANSFVPAPPLLPVPLIAAAIDHIDRGAATFVAPRRLAFQSRAPPLA